MPVGIAHEVGHLRGSGAPDRAVAVARRVAFPQKSIQQAHIGQQPARSGWQCLSDPRRSTHSTLDRYHPAARRQIERRHRSGGAGAHNQDIGVDRSAQRLSPCGKRRTLSIPERSTSSAARGPTAAATACATGCRSSTSTTDGNGPLVGPARVSTTPNVRSAFRFAADFTAGGGWIRTFRSARDHPRWEPSRCLSTSDL
jgi:hypothetical protein